MAFRGEFRRLVCVLCRERPAAPPSQLRNSVVLRYRRRERKRRAASAPIHALRRKGDQQAGIGSFLEAYLRSRGSLGSWQSWVAHSLLAALVQIARQSANCLASFSLCTFTRPSDWSPGSHSRKPPYYPLSPLSTRLDHSSRAENLGLTRGVEREGRC